MINKNLTKHSFLEAQEIISKYELQPHIEGGYFKEDFKSDIIIPKEFTNNTKRSLATTCYYLLTHADRSIFHKLTSDEIWNFYCGGPIDIFEIDAQGVLKKTTLGADMAEGQKFKHLVKRNTWFGALPQPQTLYTFLGCCVFPGFEFDDWEKGNPVFLKQLSPDSTEIIDLLT